MVGKFLLLASWVSIVNCETNNIPVVPDRGATIDCSKDRSSTDDCEITLVVEAATSMTYYNNSDTGQELRGIRAIFNSNGKLETLLKDANTEGFQEPIQTDGEFRPIITINGHMPGPTIIANKTQRLIITVYNELKNVEGISIHWHGIHHRIMDSEGADGVAYITQRPILPFDKFTYRFLASPSGTHWYHAHSGAQRTDGLYGALIVHDDLPEDSSRGEDKITDDPHNQTLILMDWQKDASIELFQTIGTSLRYWKEPDYQLYNTTRGPDNTEVGPIPFWSGIINDKGRHYNNSPMAKPNILSPSCDNLNCFNVKQGNIYRFRIIGAQALYPFRFSIEGHRFTVVATDGYLIEPIENVNYLIINTGERYDILVNTEDKEKKNYWIFAETLEDVGNSRNEEFYSPISLHRAEAILHYIGDVPMTNIPEVTATWTSCSTASICQAVNCPFSNYKDGTINCTNVDDFQSYFDISPEIRSLNTAETMFFNFGFDGENSTAGSSVDGVNFRFPTYPPLTEYTDFQNSEDTCPKRGCDHFTNAHCACTQVIDIGDRPRNSIVEMVITNIDINSSNPDGTAHPVHLHGHYFHVVHIGYPELDSDYQFMNANENVSCIRNGLDDDTCQRFINVEGERGVWTQEILWTAGDAPKELDNTNKQFVGKDTVIVPFGGYIVIRFVVDNPGWWFLHCHIEIHQLEGMAIVIKELQSGGQGKSFIYSYHLRSK